MDDDSISGLLIILVLTLLEALLTIIYAAIINARSSTLRELAEQGNPRAKTVLRLNASTNLTLTYQVLTTLIHFAIASVVVLKIAQPFLPVDPPMLDVVVVDTLILVMVALGVMVLGQIVPEAVGSSYANPLALWSGGLMSMIMLVVSPLVFVLLTVSRTLSSLVRSQGLVNTITEEEIMTLVDAGYTGGTIEDEEKDMIYSVLQLDQTRVSEMMVPRIDMTAVEINRSLDDAAAMFIQSGYSRIPVYEENIDHIRGLLYAKDLLEHWSDHEARQTKSVSDLIRSAYFVPETKRADELLKELQTKNIHMAIVIDEYGGTAGLITIEDIIEEIIGEIRDEYDFDEEEDYEQHNKTEYTVDAGIDLDDFNDLLEVDLPTADSDTLGGYIYTYFGRVPIVGDVIETDCLTMKVLSVEGRRIRKVHVIRKPKLGEIREEDTQDTGNGEKTEEAAV